MIRVMAQEHRTLKEEDDCKEVYNCNHNDSIQIHGITGKYYMTYTGGLNSNERIAEAIMEAIATTIDG